MRLSLKWKTITTLFCLYIAAFFVGICLCMLFSSRYYLNVEEEKMDRLYGVISGEVGNSNHYNNLSSFCEENSISLLIINASGQGIFSYGNSGVMVHRLNDIVFGREDSVGIIKENNNYTIQTVKDHKNKLLYIESWGFVNNGDSYIARSPYSGIVKNIKSSLTFFAFVSAIMLAFVSIVIYFLICYYTEPIRRLARLSQKVNEGDFNTKYEYKHIRQDEIAALGANITEISSKLEKNIAELKTSNLRLENELKKKADLEEARKKYMSDVSHELKTPIAIIEGYAEGLKEGISSEPEDRDYYCDVIIDESKKMNTIIKRLSTLNQLEEGASALNLVRFNVVEVIDGFLKSMMVIIDEKQAKIYFNNKEVAYVWSDEFLFEEVLVNYFNNALNHLNDEKIIAINVERTDDTHIRITVFNSGNLIPQDEMNKLWDKFYKIDKARTREYGGSGLGLSIVKAVADCLGQKCGVYNLSDGVAFWIDLESAETVPKTINKENEKELKKHERQDIISKLRVKDLPLWKTKISLDFRKKEQNNKEKKKTEEYDNATD